MKPMDAYPKCGSVSLATWSRPLLKGPLSAAGMHRQLPRQGGFVLLQNPIDFKGLA